MTNNVNNRVECEIRDNFTIHLNTNHTFCTLFDLNFNNFCIFFKKNLTFLEPSFINVEVEDKAIVNLKYERIPDKLTYT